MATIAWMWADASIIGHEVARMNPYRWSSSKSIASTIQELEATEFKERHRPVRLSQKSTSGNTFEHVHQNVAEAVADLRSQQGMSMKEALTLEAKRLEALSLEVGAQFYSTGGGGDSNGVIRKACEQLKGLEAVFEDEQSSVQVRKQFLAATFNADAELQGKAGSVQANRVGDNRASSNIVVNEKTMTPEGHNLNRNTEIKCTETGVQSEKVSLDQCKKARGTTVEAKSEAKALVNRTRCNVVGKAALVSVLVTVSTTTVITLFKTCFESYSQCEDPNHLAKLKAGIGALAKLATWQDLVVPVGSAGAIGLVTGLLGGFAEALTEHAHIFNGIMSGGGALAAVGLVLFKAYQIYQREDLCPSLKFAEFMKEMGQLGFGFVGGMLGSTLGAALLAGIPGMILGGIFGCIVGTVFGNAWTRTITFVSNRMQLGDRSALAEVGFDETGIFRIFRGGSWQGSDDTNLLLRVLSDPSCADPPDIEKALKLLDKKYRRASLEKHPDRGGSHEDFVKLQRAHEALCARLQKDSSAKTTGPLSLTAA